MSKSTRPTVEDPFRGCDSREFNVPVEEAAGLTTGQWVWKVSGWRGVREASLNSVGSRGFLIVTATPSAMKRVRKFCQGRGFTEYRG